MLPHPVPEPSPLLEARALACSFGPTRALGGVDFTLHAGEVHALAGENGAGKSTLIRIFAGAHTDFEGELRLGGNPVRFHTPSDARAAGIATLHQELSLIGSLSITDNLALGRERTSRFGWVDQRAQHDEARRLLAAVDLALDPDTRVERLPLATQQLLEIAKALALDSRILILDEPTSALGEVEAERLFASIRALRARGCGIVYISHKLEELYALADRITVLRDGVVAGVARPADLPRDRLITWMVGRPLLTAYADRATPLGPVRLEARALRTGAAEVSFSVRAGEILGLTGLRGSGNSELLHTLFGDQGPPGGGEVLLDGAPLAIESPGRALDQGVALLTKDRNTLGLLLDRSIIENTTLATLAHFSPRGWLHPREERAATEGITARQNLSAPSLDAEVSALSGGGQQKVYLGRLLLTTPKVLLLDEPTRGVDVGAKADIHARLRELAEAGTAILLITSDLDELLALSDHILVMRQGAITARVDRADFSRERVLAATMTEEP